MKREAIVGFVLLLALGGLFLNRSYAHMYNTIKEKHLLAPEPTTYTVTSTIAGPATKPFVYLALGDSLTSGVGSENVKGSYVYQLAEQLAKEKGVVQVINLGEPGGTSVDAVQTVKTFPPITPNLVTILIGVNDVHNFVPREVFKNNLEQIVRGAQVTTSARVVVISIPYLDAPALAIAPYRWWFDWRTRQYNAMVAQIAKAEKVQFIDLYALTNATYKHNGPWYSDDLFHPSAEGYRTWAQLLYERLR